MITFILILIILILLMIGILTYLFAFTFVKQNLGNVDDVDSPLNKPLEEYKEEIRQGIDFISKKPHKWVETVSFDGLKLFARYYANNSDKTIILFHGYRSSALRDFSCAVKMYLSMGFNVMLCDQRSHGRSEGKLITFGIKESKDVITWVEFIKGKFGAKNIILGGMSMGATTVLLSNNHSLPKEVKGIIADCGFTSAADIIKKVAKDSLKIDATVILHLLNVPCKVLGGFSVYESSTVDSVKNSKIPVIFIHGKDDNFVPCEMSERAFKEANEKCKLVLIDGAKHGLSYLVDTNRVENEVKNFLNVCLEC